MWIHCTHCNIIVTCQLYETVMVQILPVFIKAFVLHHVGLSCMIETKEKYYFSIDDHYTIWFTGGIWFNQTIFKTYMGPYLRISSTLHAKTDMNWCVYYTYITKKVISQLIQNKIWQWKTTTIRLYNKFLHFYMCQSKIHRKLVKNISKYYCTGMLFLSRQDEFFIKNTYWKTNLDS